MRTVDICIGQTKRLTNLVEDLLDVSRISSGHLTYQLDKVDLSDIAFEAFERHQRQFTNAESKLVVNAPKPVWVYCDRFRIDQVVSNLLSNALKYGEQTPVTMTVGEKENEGILTVKTKGKALILKNEKIIFERFERAVDSTNISGLGLGLFISRQIEEAHHGSRVETSRAMSAHPACSKIQREGRGQWFMMLLWFRFSKMAVTALVVTELS